MNGLNHTQFLAVQPGPGIFVDANVLTIPNVAETPHRLDIMPTQTERRVVITLLATQALTVIAILFGILSVALGGSPASLIFGAAAFFFLLGVNVRTVNRLATALEERRNEMVRRAIGDDEQELKDLEELIKPSPAASTAAIVPTIVTYESTAGQIGTTVQPRRGNIPVRGTQPDTMPGMLLGNFAAMINEAMDDLRVTGAPPFVPPVFAPPKPDYTKFNRVKDRQLTLHAEAARMQAANDAVGHLWTAGTRAKMRPLVDENLRLFAELRSAATDLDKHPFSTMDVKIDIAITINRLTDQFENAHRERDLDTLNLMRRDIQIVTTACRDYIASQPQ